MSKSPRAHFLHVKAQKVINYRAPLYTIFFVSILVLIIQSLKKIVRAVVCPNCEKVLFWPKFAPFGPKMGEGGFFSKI